MQMATSIETDNGDMIVKRVSVPMGLEELMEGLTKEVMLKKPKDIYAFASEYFANLLDLREKGVFKGIAGKQVQSVTKQISARENKLKSKTKSIDTVRQISKQTDSSLKKSLSTRKVILTKKEETKTANFLDKRKTRKSIKENLISQSETKSKTPRLRDLSTSSSSHTSKSEDSNSITHRNKKQDKNNEKNQQPDTSDLKKLKILQDVEKFDLQTSDSKNEKKEVVLGCTMKSDKAEDIIVQKYKDKQLDEMGVTDEVDFKQKKELVEDNTILDKDIQVLGVLSKEQVEYITEENKEKSKNENDEINFTLLDQTDKVNSEKQDKLTEFEGISEKINVEKQVEEKEKTTQQKDVLENDIKAVPLEIDIDLDKKNGEQHITEKIEIIDINIPESETKSEEIMDTTQVKQIEEEKEILAVKANEEEDTTELKETDRKTEETKTTTEEEKETKLKNQNRNSEKEIFSSEDNLKKNEADNYEVTNKNQLEAGNLQQDISTNTENELQEVVETIIIKEKVKLAEAIMPSHLINKTKVEKVTNENQEKITDLSKNVVKEEKEDVEKLNGKEAFNEINNVISFSNAMQHGTEEFEEQRSLEITAEKIPIKIQEILDGNENNSKIGTKTIRAKSLTDHICIPKDDKRKRTKSIDSTIKKSQVPLISVKKLENIQNLENGEAIRSKRSLSVDIGKQMKKKDLKHHRSFDSAKLHKEIEQISEVTNNLKFKSSYNPYQLRQEIKKVSVEKQEDEKMTICEIAREISAAIKIQTIWRGYNVRRKKQLEKNKEFEIVKAVLKIQALWRGYKVRKHRKYSDIFGSTVEIPNENRENLEILRKMDEKMAVSKIQALWRGYWVRKNIKDVKERMADLQKSDNNETINQQVPTNEDIFKAATKIQAGVRGYIVRKKRNCYTKLKSIDETPEEKLSADQGFDAITQLETIPKQLPTIEIINNFIEAEKANVEVLNEMKVNQDVNFVDIGENIIVNEREIKKTDDEATGNQKSNYIKSLDETIKDNKKTEKQTKFIVSPELNSTTANKLSTSVTSTSISDDSISNNSVNKDVGPISIASESTYEDAPTRPVTSDVIEEFTEKNQTETLNKQTILAENYMSKKTQIESEHYLNIVNENLEDKRNASFESAASIDSIDSVIFNETTGESKPENDKVTKGDNVEMPSLINQEDSRSETKSLMEIKNKLNDINMDRLIIEEDKKIYINKNDIGTNLNKTELIAQKESANQFLEIERKYSPFIDKLLIVKSPESNKNNTTETPKEIDENLIRSVESETLENKIIEKNERMDDKCYQSETNEEKENQIDATTEETGNFKKTNLTTMDTAFEENKNKYQKESLNLFLDAERKHFSSLKETKEIEIQCSEKTPIEDITAKKTFFSLVHTGELHDSMVPETIYEEVKNEQDKIQKSSCISIQNQIQDVQMASEPDIKTATVLIEPNDLKKEDSLNLYLVHTGELHDIVLPTCTDKDIKDKEEKIEELEAIKEVKTKVDTDSSNKDVKEKMEELICVATKNEDRVVNETKINDENNLNDEENIDFGLTHTGELHDNILPIGSDKNTKNKKCKTQERFSVPTQIEEVQQIINADTKENEKYITNSTKMPLSDENGFVDRDNLSLKKLDDNVTPENINSNLNNKRENLPQLNSTTSEVDLKTENFGQLDIQNQIYLDENKVTAEKCETNEIEKSDENVKEQELKPQKVIDKKEEFDKLEMEKENIGLVTKNESGIKIEFEDSEQHKIIEEDIKTISEKQISEEKLEDSQLDKNTEQYISNNESNTMDEEDKHMSIKSQIESKMTNDNDKKINESTIEEKNIILTSHDQEKENNNYATQNYMEDDHVENDEEGRMNQIKVKIMPKTASIKKEFDIETLRKEIESIKPALSLPHQNSVVESSSNDEEYNKLNKTNLEWEIEEASKHLKELVTKNSIEETDESKTEQIESDNNKLIMSRLNEEIKHHFQQGVNEEQLKLSIELDDDELTPIHMPLRELSDIKEEDTDFRSLTESVEDLEYDKQRTNRSENLESSEIEMGKSENPVTKITIGQNSVDVGSTKINLIHTGEFHDSIRIPAGSPPPKMTSSDLKEDIKQEKSAEGLLHTGETHDNVVPPVSVYLNEATPAGAEILTSHLPKSISNDVQDSAQASNKDASTCETQTDNSTSSDSMETEKRNNSSLQKKSMEAEAATKIQAGFRGYQVRKQLKNKISSPGDISNQRRSARRKSSGRIMDSKRMTQNKNKNSSDIEEKSAVKIQAGVRGFLVRRRQKKQKQVKESS